AGATGRAQGRVQHWEEWGPPAAAPRRHNLTRSLDQPRQVVAVELLRGHAVGSRPLADCGRPLSAALVRVNGVLVVLADKKDRQSLQDGEVERLGEDAFLGRAVAEEAGYDGRLAAEAQGVGVAGGSGDGRAGHG